jgi:hypothetical protein
VSLGGVFWLQLQQYSHNSKVCNRFLGADTDLPVDLDTANTVRWISLMGIPCTWQGWERLCIFDGLSIHDFQQPYRQHLAHFQTFLQELAKHPLQRSARSPLLLNCSADEVIHSEAM